MSHKVHDRSMLGRGIGSDSSKSKYDPHTKLPDTNMSVIEAYEEFVYPITPVTAVLVGVQNSQAGSVIIFESAQVQDYTSLKDSYFIIRGHWEQYDSVAVNNDIVDLSQNETACAGFPTGLFSQVNMYLNGSKVTPARGSQHYIDFVNRVLLCREASNENSLTTGATDLSNYDNGLYLDYLDTFENSYALSDGGSISGPDSTIFSAAGESVLSEAFIYNATNVPVNTGAIARTNTIVADSTGAGDLGQISYIYRPSLAVVGLDKPIPDRIQIRSELTIASNIFYTFGFNVETDEATFTSPWDFAIDEIIMVLHRIRLRQEVKEENNLKMLENPWVAPGLETIYQSSRLASGSSNYVLSQVYQGSRPAMVAIALQSVARAIVTTGVTQYLNPWFFDQGTVTYIAGIIDGWVNGTQFLSQIWIEVDGVKHPRKEYQFNTSAISQPFSNIRGWRAFLSACGKWDNVANCVSSVSPLISYQQYVKVHPLHIFWVNPSEKLYDEWSPTSDSAINVYVSFRGAAGTGSQPSAWATDILAHIFCFIPTTLEVDGSRVCKMVTRAGAPLSFTV